MNFKTTLLAIIFLFVGISSVSAQTDFNLKYANDLINKGQFEQAKPFADTFIKEYPNDPRGYMLKTVILHNQDSLFLAIENISTAISICINNNDQSIDRVVYIINYRAKLYMEAELYDQSIADYTILIGVMPEDSIDMRNDFYFDRAGVYYNAKMYSKAEDDYKQILTTNPQATSAMAGLMRNFLVEEKYDKVISLAEKAIAIDSAYYELYRFRLQAYHALGEHKKCIDDVFTYIRFNDYEFNSEGVTKYLEVDYPYTLTKLEPLVEAYPNNTSLLILAISIYNNTDKYSKELAAINQLERLIPTMFAIPFQRSFCYINLADTASALADIDKALILAEDRADSASVYEQRANIYMSSARYADALADFDIVIALGDDGFAYYRRAWCLEMMEEYDKAIIDLNKVIEINPNFASAYERRGSIYLKMGEEKKAKKDFKQVIRRDKEVHINSSRPGAYYYLGKYDKAIEWQQKIVSANPNSYVAYYNLACLYAKMNKATEALRALEEAFVHNYRHFDHIDNDEDLDNIRQLLEFKVLIEKYKGTAVTE